MNSMASSVALLTPPGRGAVATLLVRGDLAHLAAKRLFRAVNSKPVDDQPVGRIVFGHWVGSDDSQAGEEVVVCRRTLDELEIHCHGGSAAVARIIADLGSVGFRSLTWQQQTAEQEGRLAAESLEALASAPTLRTAAILARQVEGLFRKAIERLLKRSLDGPDDFVVAKAELEQLLEWSRFGLHLTRPWRVVLTGRPNVGKSSLINALLGYTRSIVYDEPGTTRDVVTAETAFDGWPVELADTAGLRESAAGLEAEGIALAQERLTTAECRVLLLDRSQPLTGEDFSLLSAWPEAVVVAHKADLADAWREAQSKPFNAVLVSSRTGAGIEQLIREIVQRVVPRVPEEDVAIPFTERQCRLLQRTNEGCVAADRTLVRESLEELLG